MARMQELQDDISAWAESTFKHTERGIVLHLLREAVELCAAVGVSWRDITNSVASELVKKDNGGLKTVEEETADVTILALAMAGYCGFSLEDAVIAKHAVNQSRRWGQPDEQGITEHVEED